MRDLKRPEGVAQKTLSRRSLLDWLGKATVLGLGGSFLTRCVAEPLDEDENSLGTDSDVNSDVCDSEGDGVFGPGDGSHPVYDEFFEYTVDHQNIEEILESWTLRIDGLVENPIELTFKELLELPRQDQITDFHCVVGWSVYDVPWNGVHLGTLFDIVKPLPSATHVTFHTVGDKYNESLPIDVATEPKTLLSYGIECSTLPLGHGFPVRLIVPRLLGYKNAKYVYRIELDDKEVEGYWEQRGYSISGEVPEDRLRPGMY